MRPILPLVLVLCASPAFADDPYCDMWSDLGAVDAAPALYRVKDGVGKALFQTNSVDGYSCPGADKRCSANAYLIGDDPVVVTSLAGDYACATFTNDGKENISTTGWLPLAQLEPVEAAAKEEDFTGSWRTGEEQEIEISVADGTLQISGDATWGASDPQRVANGGVNVGEISAAVTPEGNLAAWTEVGDVTEAWREGDADYLCAVRMWALPPFLAVSDNGMCGGNNVTFTGVYAQGEVN
jgi:hypothetical protein